MHLKTKALKRIEAVAICSFVLGLATKFIINKYTLQENLTITECLDASAILHAWFIMRSCRESSGRWYNYHDPQIHMIVEHTNV